MQQVEEAVEQALCRSYLYHFLSTLFLYPDERLLCGLDWEKAKDAVAGLEAPELGEVLAALEAARLPFEALRSAFTKVFGYTIQGDCPPYETMYGGDDYLGNGQLAAAQLFGQSQELADLAGFYRAWGLDLSDQVKERVDHLATELEFMAFLAYKEACALVAEGEERAEKLEVTRDCQRKFLSDHLGRWIGAFARYLSEKAERVKADFYFRLAQLTEKFVRAECRRLDAHPTELTRLAPMAPEPPGMCDPLAGGQEGSCGPCGPCGGGGEEGGNVIWTGLSPAS